MGPVTDGALRTATAATQTWMESVMKTARKTATIAKNAWRRSTEKVAKVLRAKVLRKARRAIRTEKEKEKAAKEKERAAKENDSDPSRLSFIDDAISMFCHSFYLNTIK